MTGLEIAASAPFLARLVHLDRAAPVRLRPAGPGRVALWGRTPWEVLATRLVPGEVPADVTVSAAALLAALEAGRDALPPARDSDWRWGLPPDAGRPVEDLPAAEMIKLGEAAERTLREARGGHGERALRDALLDHVAVVVSSGSTRIEVRQSLVQALLRMGFTNTQDNGSITVRIASKWVGIAAKYGVVWQQSTQKLAIRISR